MHGESDDDLILEKVGAESVKSKISSKKSLKLENATLFVKWGIPS